MKLEKRIFDLFFTIPGFLLLLPIGLVISFLIKLIDRGSIFYLQDRVGYKGKPFKMYKYRTMVADADKKGALITLGNDPRVTVIGSFLRKCKVDELPQLLNVIKGDMSLVGPRPEVSKYVELYTEDQKKVLDIMTGITDPASLKYRDESSLLGKSDDPESLYINEIMPDKIKINLEYANKATVFTDFYFILKTIFKR
jgi:lipopolysaccharide/colanic/teichoic acid biosynthesis glycosyltransferase